jgi:hypothetical protein
MAQSRSYSCDKLTMRQAEWDVLDLITKLLKFPDENYSYPARELFVTSCCLYSKINRFDCFHIQGLHIFASSASDCH